MQVSRPGDLAPRILAIPGKIYVVLMTYLMTSVAQIIQCWMIWWLIGYKREMMWKEAVAVCFKFISRSAGGKHRKSQSLGRIWPRI